jgi:signal transduction histidine kinase
MNSHEIRPNQLRALLLLLVIVPLIPTGLMLRFMLDTVHSERTAALERLSAIYQQTLANADATFARHIAGRRETITPREAHKYYRELLDRDVLVRVIDANGQALTGNTVVTGAPVAQSSLREVGLPWSVQVFLLDAEKLNTDQEQQLRSYLRTVGLVVVVILAFAALAVVIVNRQLELRELRNTAVATVAHELRTPLASMRMLVDTLREGRYRSEEQLREYLTLVARENERLTRLTEDFLAFSRIESGAHRLDLRPIAPRAVIDQAITLLGPRLAAPGCTFRLDVPGNLPDILADRDALTTVLTNLLDNALKYTEAEKHITLRARLASDAVTLAVIDNGIGIPHDQQRQIFRPFHQADARLSRTREGIGLGLSIVGRLVAAQRGRVRVESEPGHGSTFTVTIPLAPQSVIRPPEPSPIA